MADKATKAREEQGDDTPKDEKPSKDDYTRSAAVWRTRYQLAYNHQLPLFRKIADWYKLMYAIKTYKNIGIWKSQVFIPIMSYKVWTIIAKLLALRPGFSVKMYDKVYSREDAERINKANLKLEYDYDNPMLDESIRDRLFDPLSDAVIGGTGFAIAPWTSGTNKTYDHFKKGDGTIDYSKSNVEESDFGYNDLQPLSVFDVFGAPGKRSWEKKPWHIIHMSKTKAELLSSGLYSEETIRALKPVGGQGKEVSQLKQSRNQFLSQSGEDVDTMDDTVDNFDVFVCNEKTAKGIFSCTFVEAARESGDRSQTEDSKEQSTWKRIREDKQPYWHNKYALVPFYIRRRPHDCWGESIFEVTESMANSYNDIFNQFADNLAVVGAGGILMHETGTTIYDFFYGPGGEIRYSGAKPEFVTPDSPDIQFFQMMMGLLEKGVEWGTVSSYAGGAPSDTSDATQGTAEGIQRLQEAAGEIVTFMKSNFMQSLRAVGQRWLSNNRQFMDDDMTLETKKRGKTRHTTITAEDFTRTMYMTIDEASMQPDTKEQKIATDKAWLADIFAMVDRAGLQAQAAAQDPVLSAKLKPIYLNYEELMAEVSDNYGKTDFEHFILSDQEQQTDGDPNSSNMNLINAIRAQIDEGDMDSALGQQIIDQLEGGQPSAQQQPTPEQAAIIAAANAGSNPAPAGQPSGPGPAVPIAPPALQ
jgi:hypothetical protein